MPLNIAGKSFRVENASLGGAIFHKSWRKFDPSIGEGLEYFLVIGRETKSVYVDGEEEEWEPQLEYKALKDVITESAPTAEQVFHTVCQIRQSKLPDPVRLGNAGSFFKNPVITTDKYQKLKQEFPKLPCYPSTEPDLVKLPAAWLLDHLGWKGRSRGAAAARS